MWSDTPPATAPECTICGRSGACGPFWIGPEFLTGGATIGQTAERKAFVMCRECLFVEVNRPESPFHGLLPAGMEAEVTVSQAAAEIETQRRRIEKLEERGGLTKTVAAHAVEAALEALDARGYKVARKPGPAPKAPA